MRFRVHPAVPLTLGCLLALVGLLRATWLWRETMRPLALGQSSPLIAVVPEGLLYVTLDQRELPALDRWIANPPKPGATRLVLLSDSLAICHGGAYVGPLVELSLRRSGRNATVLPLVHPGLRPSTFFFLADRVAEGRPDLVLVEVNPRAFEHDDAASSADPAHAAAFAAFGFHNLSRFLSARTALRWPTALSVEGLTPIDPWIYGWQEQLGLLYVADGLRTWIQQQFESWALAIGQLPFVGRWIGTSDPAIRQLVVATRTDLFPQLAAKRSARAYSLDFANHSSARVLRELREEFVSRAIPVLFYVPPLNVVGVRNETGDQDFDRGLAERLAALREAIGARDEEWLDLHDAANPETFADLASHMNDEGCELVAGRIAQRLARRKGGQLPAAAPGLRTGNR